MDRDKLNILGKGFFSSCVSATKHFLEGISKSDNKLASPPPKEDLVVEEILIAYMWVFVHIINLLRKKDLNPALDFMHTEYLKMLNAPKNERDLIMKQLEKRYDQYKDAFQTPYRDDQRPVNFELLSMEIAENIYPEKTPSTNFIFHLFINTSFSPFMNEMTKFIKNKI